MSHLARFRVLQCVYTCICMCIYTHFHIRVSVYVCRTLRASWYSSRRANASHKSTESGQHPSSTARVSSTLAASCRQRTRSVVREYILYKRTHSIVREQYPCPSCRKRTRSVVREHVLYKRTHSIVREQCPCRILS